VPYFGILKDFNWHSPEKLPETGK